MVDQPRPVRRAMISIHSEPAEKDNVTEAIGYALHEVQAARRDLTITAFCMRQAEMLRRIDRAKASLADLVQSRDGGQTGPRVSVVVTISESCPAPSLGLGAELAMERESRTSIEPARKPTAS